MLSTARRARTVPALLALTVLAACGGSRVQPPDEALTSFETSTSRDGLRFFTYQVEMPRVPARAPQTSGAARPHEIPRDTNPRGRDRERFNESLDMGLRQKLDETGYCPDGFLVIDRYTLPGRATIRGECL